MMIDHDLDVIKTILCLDLYLAYKKKHYQHCTRQSSRHHVVSWLEKLSQEVNRISSAESHVLMEPLKTSIHLLLIAIHSSCLIIQLLWRRVKETIVRVFTKHNCNSAYRITILTVISNPSNKQLAVASLKISCGYWLIHRLIIADSTDCAIIGWSIFTIVIIIVITRIVYSPLSKIITMKHSELFICRRQKSNLRSRLAAIANNGLQWAIAKVLHLECVDTSVIHECSQYETDYFMTFVARI